MAATLPAIRRIGPYRLEEQLGAGGMGEVYRAFDERLERAVALKRIRVDTADDDRARRRFRREARAGARLSHPNIARVHDVLANDDGDWIVMELVAGVPLGRLLEDGPLGAKRTVDLGVQLAAALTAAHAEGIVHRDLKARNAVVTPDGVVKVLDFGLAKQVLDRGVTSTSISVEGQMIGTPHAMSPEQAMGRKVDPRSDLFSLGSLLYEMATGTSPFRGPYPLETLKRVCTRRQVPARELSPGVPRELSDLIDRLLEKDPGHRPQTAGEVVLALQRVADASVAEAENDADRTISVDGQTLAAEETAITESKRRPRTRRPPSERRQVTVLCCELVSSAAGSGSLDAESLYRVVDDFQDRSRKAIESFEGHVANDLGHRLVAYFGYPQAHEDDAPRAVRAALGLVARGTAPTDASASSPDVAVRVGVHTGAAVFLRDGTQQEQVALGSTLDLAISLQRQAQPGHVVVSNATHQLIEGGFREEALEGAVGHRVVEVRTSSSCWDVVGGMTPLVAREQECRLLLDRWRLAQLGNGQVVLLSGEAGIGKSRLVQALRERLTGNSFKWLHASGSSYAQNSPLHPILEMLRHTLELAADANLTMSEQLERLEDGLARYGCSEAKTAQLLASLFGLPQGDRYPPLYLSPQKQREETFAAIIRLVTAMASQRPLVLLIEDLHWADPSTLELLGLLIQNTKAAPIFLLLTFRPEFQASWSHDTHMCQLDLSRLAGRDVLALIDRVAKGKALPAEVQEQIVAKTDGVPLFIEELTKDILESGLLIASDDRYVMSGSLDDLEIPATLRDSLTARLDRLGKTKEIAQLAAVIGREFTYELLAATAQCDKETLRGELDRLVAAELVYRKGFSSKQRYFFKHALIQDAAYDSLLKPRMRECHFNIADTLLRLFPEKADKEPELLAHHYSQAHQFGVAIDYWQKAGAKSFESCALVEATNHLDRGLALLGRLADEPRREQREILLQSTRGAALGAARGYAADGVEQAYFRGLELCRRAPDNPALFWVLHGLCRCYSARADVAQAEDTAQWMIRIADGQESAAKRMAAYSWAGSAQFLRGKFDSALQSLEKSIAFDTIDRTRHYAARTGQDPGVLSLSVSARCFWFLGFPDRAEKRLERAYALAEKISHPFSLTNALHCAISVAFNRREPKRVLSRAEKVTALSLKHGSFWKALTHVYADWARMVMRYETRYSEMVSPAADDNDALEGIQWAIDQQTAIGANYFLSQYLSMAAEIAMWKGQLDGAMRFLQQALAHIDKTGERFYESEIYRLLGELELKIDAAREGSAEKHLELACEVARAQNAKSLELRAATSLSRSWSKQGKNREAQALLTPIYNWFSEGFDTADLQEARAVLGSLTFAA